MVLLAITTVGSVLAIGSVHLPALVVVSLFAAAAAAATLRRRLPATLALPAAVAWALAVYSALQAIPIPIDVLRKIAPRTADVWVRALVPLGEPGPGWAPLSHDGGASVVEALKWVTYAFTFVAAASVGLRRGAAWGLGVVFIAGCAAALTTLGHGLVGAQHVYGLYKPSYAAPAWHVGPLLNPNNLAGYLNLTTLIGVGFLLSRKSRAPRWLLALAVAAVTGVGLSTGSRGGAMVLLIALVSLTASLLLHGRGRDRDATSPRAGALRLGAVAGGGALLAYLGSTTQTWAQLLDKDLAKLNFAVWAKPLVVEHAWLGIGRGAFESVFPAYRSEPGNVVYSHAENFPVQWAVEWGVPVTVLAISAFAWLLRPARLGARKSETATAAWIGIGAVALQNLVDLALEVPAVMIALAVAAGSLAGGAQRRRTDVQGRQFLLPRTLGYGAAATAMLLSLLAIRYGSHAVGADREAVHQRLIDARDAGKRKELRALLRAAMLRHPAEPYFPLVGAQVAWDSRDGNPLPWLGRALERSPSNARIHLLAADVTARSGGSRQAFMHLRMAAELDADVAASVASRAVRSSRDHSTLMQVVPNGSRAAVMLEALARALPAVERSDLRRRLLRQALDADPGRVSVNEALAWDYIGEIAMGETSTACAGTSRGGCIAAAARHAELVEKAVPRHSGGLRARAALLRRTGRAEEAERLLAGRCNSMSDRPVCLQARLEAAAEARPSTQLPAAIKEYLASRCAKAEDCAAAASLVGELEIGRGEPGSALGYFRRAATEAPTEQRWLKLADAASAIGAHAQAAEALEKVARLRGRVDDQLNARIASERAAAMQREPTVGTRENPAADGGI